VKRFLQIVGGALLLFIALAMLEERQTFARNWFASAQAYRATEAEQRAATRAVHEFRTLAAHWYGTNGDRRFADRLPATAPVIDEVRADIEYVRRNGRIETPHLMRLEILAADVTSESAAEVRTREFWVTEFHWPAGGASDPPRSDIVFAKYRLMRDGGHWIVSAWDPIDPPQEEVAP
jgi:hypothetical protein